MTDFTLAGITHAGQRIITWTSHRNTPMLTITNGIHSVWMPMDDVPHLAAMMLKAWSDHHLPTMTAQELKDATGVDPVLPDNPT